jgi:hypothetical protein
MNLQQRIEALERALAAAEAAIARVEAALPFATTLEDVKKLNAQLALLKSERFNLGNQLANLRGATPTLTPLNAADAARLGGLSTALDDAIGDRATVGAAIDFASGVLDKVRELKSGLS